METENSEASARHRSCPHCDGQGSLQHVEERRSPSGRLLERKTTRSWCAPCEGTGTEGGLPWGLRTPRTPEEDADAERWDNAVKSASEWYQANR